MNREQYLMICARRQSYDNLIWQTPPLAMAAQAFLLATSFDSETPPRIAVVLATFSACVGLASLQLIAKHRFHERCDARILARYEAEHENEGLSVLHGRRNAKLMTGPLTRMSAYWVWFSVLGGVCLLALYAAVSAFFRN